MSKAQPKVLVITSSTSVKSSSVELARNAMEGSRQAGAEVELIHLPDMDLDYCRGCLRCLSGTRCVLEDDLNLIRVKMEEADGLILSSPTHALAPNAVMKNFLDRIGIYSVYRSNLDGKYLIGLSTSGAMGEKKVAKELASSTDGFFSRAYISGHLGVKIGHGNINEKPDEITKARKLGTKLVNDIKKGKRFPFQKIPKRFLNSMVLKRVMRKNLRSNRDGVMKGAYEHAHEHGDL